MWFDTIIYNAFIMNSDILKSSPTLGVVSDPLTVLKKKNIYINFSLCNESLTIIN